MTPQEQQKRAEVLEQQLKTAKEQENAALATQSAMRKFEVFLENYAAMKGFRHEEYEPYHHLQRQQEQEPREVLTESNDQGTSYTILR